MPPHQNCRPCQPGDPPCPRQPQPEIPIDDVAQRRVEAPHLLKRGDVQGHRRAAERIAAGHRRREPARLDDTVDRSQSPLLDHCWRSTGWPRSSITMRGARDHAEGTVGNERCRVGRKMPGQHHVILVEDGNQGRAGERRAAVPVSRQAQALGVDLDPGPVAGRRADHGDACRLRSGRRRRSARKADRLATECCGRPRATWDAPLQVGMATVNKSGSVCEAATRVSASVRAWRRFAQRPQGFPGE